MKTLLLFFCALFLLTLTAAGQMASTKRSAPAGAPTATADEQVFAALIEQVGATIEKRDMTALGKLMAPEYIHYNPNNSVGKREEELAFIATWSETTVKLAGPVMVKRDGNTAVTVSNSIFSGTYENKPFSRNINMMIMWVLRDGRWQMAVVQSKEIPA